MYFFCSMFQTRHYFCRSSLFLKQTCRNASLGYPNRQPASSSFLVSPSSFLNVTYTHLPNSRNCSLQQTQQFSRITPQKKQHFCTIATRNFGSHYTNNSSTETTIGVDRFEERLFQLGPNNKCLLKIELQQRKIDGRKQFIITKTTEASIDRPLVFLPIVVDEEAYEIVRAMDRLLQVLPSIEEQPKEKDYNVLIHHTQKVFCQHYIYYLMIKWFDRSDMTFLFERLRLGGQKEKTISYPIRALPWMRTTIAQLLAEHDGTEGLIKIPKLPEWILQEKLIEESQRKP